MLLVYQMRSLFKRLAIHFDLGKGLPKLISWVLIGILILALTGLPFFTQELLAEPDRTAASSFAQRRSAELELVGTANPQQGLTDPQELEAFLDQ